jgi:hypothetical protein
MSMDVAELHVSCIVCLVKTKRVTVEICTICTSAHLSALHTHCSGITCP